MSESGIYLANIRARFDSYITSQGRLVDYCLAITPPLVHEIMKYDVSLAL